MAQVLLGGVTFTTTNLSADEKSKVFDMITSMGGKVKNDLTSETNVLIVGSIDTAKFKYCLKNRTDVTLLYPDDLFDIYKRFKEKSIQPLTIKILDDYPWPIFNSCLFCLSRLREVENPCYEKNYITKLIDHFGGKSIASLTPKVTYLITDKREGKRYESAIDWNISPIHPKWIIDSCNCQRILDPSLYDISKIENSALIGINSHKKFRNVIDYGSTESNPIYDKVNTKIAKSNTTADIKVGFFKGFIFSYFGFDNQQIEKLSKILKSNEAETQDDYDLSVTHFVIPSTFQYDRIPAKILKLQEISDSKIVNEWFIERCLHYKKVLNDSWSLPPKRLNLDYNLKIHITGFTEIEHLHITKLIKNLNLSLKTELTDDCDFLIANLTSLGLNKTNSPQLYAYKFHDILTSRTLTNDSSVSLTKKKINSAKKWNIPVVTLAFLWELSQTGILPHVLDTKWCIFAPRSLRPASNFLEYARSVSGGTFHTQKEGSTKEGMHGLRDDINDNESDGDDFVNNDSGVNSFSNTSPIKLPAQLPSPRKNKPKNWPKLVGTASESQLKLTADISNDSEFKGARKLLFDENIDNNRDEILGDIRGKNYIDFGEDVGLDDMPIFKKRRL